MNPISHRPVARRALALGLAAGSWLVLSGFAPGVDPWLIGAQQAATAPDRILLAQADVAPVQSPVSYSSAQADRGEEQFTKHCVECHGEDLKGGLLGGAPLRGLAFEGKYIYEGAPAGALFDVMTATMPPDSPGRYSASTYADLMAYILKRNGFQAGAELPSDSEALYSLIMEK